MPNKINFKKILLISIPLAVVVYIFSNFSALLVLPNDTHLGIKFLVQAFAYSMIYYYIYSLLLLSVFAYIRSSLPEDFRKAGLIFAIIVFLIGSAPYSFFQIFPSMFDQVFKLETMFSPFYTIIPNIISLFFVGMAISYSYNKYYK